MKTEKPEEACVRSRSDTLIGEQIGRELRVLFDDVVSQPVPDRFLELLNQLEKATISKE